MTESIKPSKTSGIKIAIAVIPALLILSICIALYLGVHADQEESEPAEGEVTVPELAGYLKKLNGLIGERGVATVDGQKALRQVAAMTMGSLGPENLGYEIFKEQKDSAGGLLWPTIWINAGDRESDNPVVVAIPQAGSGTPAAFAYGFAEYLTSHETKVGVRMVFYPPVAVSQDLAAWVWDRCGAEGETMQSFIEITGEGPQPEWAAIAGQSKDLPRIEELSNRKGWAGNIEVEEGPAARLQLALTERGNGSQEEHAARLIRVMPFMKELVETLAE